MLGLCDPVAASQQVPYLVEVGTGFDGPADVTTWPGNPDLLVVAERGSGQVVISPVPPPSSSPGTEPGSGPPPSASTEDIIVDLSSTAYIPDSTASWKVQFGGLTGVAFHPRFNDGRRYRYIFVRYITGDPGSQSNPVVDVVIERFAIPTGVTYADMSSRTTVFREPFLAGGGGSHTSGRIRFDPRTFYDGTGTTVDDEIYHLHAPMGDMVPGSGECKVGFEDAYNLTDNSVPPNNLYAGKLLRFSIGPGVLASGPSVPVVDPDVYGQGLRNPYSFTVDRGGESLATEGEVWLTDTGQFVNGEIMRWVPPAEGALDLLSGGSGENYGWPWVETEVTDVGGVDTLNNVTSVCWTGWFGGPPPFSNPANYGLADYSTPETGPVAPIGISIYRGEALDAPYEGLLLYGIFNVSPPPLVWRNRSDLLAASPELDLLTQSQTGVEFFTDSGTEQFLLAGMGEDTNGEILLIRMDGNVNTLAGNGTIFRVTQ